MKKGLEIHMFKKENVEACQEVEVDHELGW
jgi:hypothetical protein